MLNQLSSNPRSPRRTIAIQTHFQVLRLFAVPILDRPEERSQYDPRIPIDRATVFQSSIAPKNDRNLQGVWGFHLLRFQSSIAPKNDRNSAFDRLVAIADVPILDRPEERSQSCHTLGLINSFRSNPRSPRRTIAIFPRVRIS